MKIVPVVQGSPEWLQARLGLPTSSEFHRIIQPVKRKASSGQADYKAKLIAEWLIGEPLDTYVSPFMERGTELEASAVATYEFEADITTTAVGLCLTDDEKAGASPDRLVGDDGVLEIKCPSAEKHVGYLLDPRGLVEDYFTQVHGEMFVCERAWADLFSYHPTLPAVRVRVPRDAEFIDAFAPLLAAFVADLDAAKEKLAAHRIVRVRRVVNRDPDPFATEPIEGETAWS